MWMPLVFETLLFKEEHELSVSYLVEGSIQYIVKMPNAPHLCIWKKRKKTVDPIQVWSNMCACIRMLKSVPSIW